VKPEDLKPDEQARAAGGSRRAARASRPAPMMQMEAMLLLAEK